jgi:hypothetical protein
VLAQHPDELCKLVTNSAVGSLLDEVVCIRHVNQKKPASNFESPNVRSVEYEGIEEIPERCSSLAMKLLRKCVLLLPPNFAQNSHSIEKRGVIQQ